MRNKSNKNAGSLIWLFVFYEIYQVIVVWLQALKTQAFLSCLMFANYSKKNIVTFKL